MKAIAILALAACPAMWADVVLFSDNFESGSFGSQWATIGSAAIVANPVVSGNTSNNVLHFTNFGAGGDLFSKPITFTGSGTVRIKFDYLSTQDASNLPGGFLGYNQLPGNNGTETWLFGDASWGPTVNPTTATPRGVWYSFDQTVNVTSGFELKLEHYVGSGGTVGTFYFDNIVVSQSVPEPTTLGIFGMAFAGVAFLRRRAA